MSEFGTAPNPFLLFEAYSSAKMQRLAYLDGVLHEAMPILADHEAPGGTNERLVALERPDLVITEPATMMPVSHPLEIAAACNNFTPNFRMATGMRETGELDLHDRPIKEAIPPTEEDVLALRGLPKIEDYEQADELRKSGRFAAFALMTHATKPSFVRALNLFPELITTLVTEISQPENQHNYRSFDAELFVAYQLMSRLVDQSDIYVLDDSGTIQDWYLCK